MEKPGYIDTYYARTLHGSTAYPALHGTQAADVCGIGGGLAGPSTALGLQERGKTAIVLEQKNIGWGASGRNGGFVAKGYAAGAPALARRLGDARARALIDLTKDARRLIRARIDRFNIDCGPVRD